MMRFFLFGLLMLALNATATKTAIAQTTSTVQLEDCQAQSFRLRTGPYTLTYDPAQNAERKGWIYIKRDGVEDGLATKLANGQFLDVTDLGAGEGLIYRWQDERKDHVMFKSLSAEETESTITIHIKSTRQWADFDSVLQVYKNVPGLIHWKVDVTAKRDQAFSGQNKPDCFFTIGDKVSEWFDHPRQAVRYSTQRGPNAGIVYFRDLAMNSLVFYFEDLSSMNDLYRLTGCETPYDYPTEGNPGAVKMGKAEMWFQMASPDGENVQAMKPYVEKVAEYNQFGYERPTGLRVPKGAHLTFTDTYLYLRPSQCPGNAEICRNFVEMLAQVYPHITKPPTVKTDWAGEVVPQMAKDIMRPANTSTVQDTYKIPRAYVGYEHEDNQLWTVLNLLHPLELYVKKYPNQPEAQELYRRLNECLPLFFDKEWGGFHNAMAPIHQDQFFTVVYIFSQAVMMSDLALLGNENAKMMITGFRDTLLKMGKAYDYVMADIWLRDFSKQKTFYQADSTACYIYVMMALYELSEGKDTECLQAAQAAADKLSERCMDLMWEANMTAAGVVGCEKLYKATGEERYRELAFIPMANVLREAWLWECDFGIGEKTTNFWAISGCPAAPCSAEFENHRVRLHFKDYAQMAKDHLPADVTDLLNDAWRRGPTQSRYTLPPLIIRDGAQDILPEEGRLQTNCGEISYDQMIPLEDIRVGWGTDIEWWQNNAKPGVVGQEIYGAGGPVWYALWQDEID